LYWAEVLPMANRQKPNAQDKPQVPQISVVAEFEALLRTEQHRHARLRDREELTGKYSREGTESSKHLQALYESYFREIQQELGLVPAYRRAPRPETAPPEEVVRHPGFPFLSSDEARDVFMWEELEKEGKINIIEAYKLAGAINRYRAEQEAKRGPL
jgi:hypothetical protein